MSEEKDTNYLVGARVKEYWSGKELRCAGDTLDVLNKKIEAILADAAVRCKANGRMTVKPEDL